MVTTIKGGVNSSGREVTIFFAEDPCKPGCKQRSYAPSSSFGDVDFFLGYPGDDDRIVSFKMWFPDVEDYRTIKLYDKDYNVVVEHINPICLEQKQHKIEIAVGGKEFKIHATKHGLVLEDVLHPSGSVFRYGGVSKRYYNICFERTYVHPETGKIHVDYLKVEPMDFVNTIT